MTALTRKFSATKYLSSFFLKCLSRPAPPICKICEMLCVGMLTLRKLPSANRADDRHTSNWINNPPLRLADPSAIFQRVYRRHIYSSTVWLVRQLPALIYPQTKQNYATTPRSNLLDLEAWRHRGTLDVKELDSSSSSDVTLPFNSSGSDTSVSPKSVFSTVRETLVQTSVQYFRNGYCSR